MCHDVDRDAIHLVGKVRMSDAIPSAHVAAMKELEKRLFGRFMDFIVAWPKDAGHRDYSLIRDDTLCAARCPLVSLRVIRAVKLKSKAPALRGLLFDDLAGRT
jgi:hypothetical protein